MEQNTNKQENTQNGSVRSRSEAEPMLVYYLNILRRRLPILIVFFVIALTVGLINAFRSPRIYQSAAKILVEKSTTRIKNLEGVIQDGSWWDPDYYNTQVELIRSRVVLDSALESLESARSQGLGHADKDDSSVIGVIKENVLAMFGSTPMPSKEEWEHARGQVHAVYMTGTHFILIKGESRSALYAAKLANAVARSYERYHVNQRKEMHTDVFAFLRKERDKEEQALNSSEQALQDFREKAKSVSLSDDKKKQPDIQRLDELNRELTDTQLKRINLTAHLKVIKEIQGKEKDPASRIRRLASVPVLKDSSTVVEAQKKLTKSEQVAASLSETYGSEHPLMKAAMADVGILKKQVKNSLYKSILAVIHEIRSLKAKEQELADQYEAQKVVALASAKESFQFARLQNEVNQHRRLFETISQRMQEVDVSSGFARTNAKVVESAEPSTVPIRPRKIRMVMLSVFFGLFLGVGLALFLENLDDTIKTPEDLKSRLNIPLLGFVPKMDNEKTKDGKPIAPATVSMTEPASSMSEAYRNIRTSLLISIPDSDVKILAFTSCGPSEGKT
ncbi:MAG: hypothetical protein KAH23_07960, partial [Kiritimatiellae bacterium]|nr:hypothetical protein [Kiritimatiellia bacterium]